MKQMKVRRGNPPVEYWHRSKNAVREEQCKPLAGLVPYALRKTRARDGRTFLNLKLCSSEPRRGSANFWLSYSVDESVLMRDGGFYRLCLNLNLSDDAAAQTAVARFLARWCKAVLKLEAEGSIDPAPVREAGEGRRHQRVEDLL